VSCPTRAVATPGHGGRVNTFLPVAQRMTRAGVRAVVAHGHQYAGDGHQNTPLIVKVSRFVPVSMTKKVCSSCHKKDQTAVRQLQGPLAEVSQHFERP
jgi:hypothetical protein